MFHPIFEPANSYAFGRGLNDWPKFFRDLTNILKKVLGELGGEML